MAKPVKTFLVSDMLSIAELREAVLGKPIQFLIGETKVPLFVAPRVVARVKGVTLLGQEYYKVTFVDCSGTSLLFPADTVEVYKG